MIFIFRKRKVANDDIPCNDTQGTEVNRLREKLEAQSAFIIGVLTELNSLLQLMTSLDYVKKMIMDSNEQTEMVESLAASSQEMNSSTEDISDFAQNSYHASSKSIISAQTSLSKIDGTFRMIKENMDKTMQVKSTMELVTGETTKIHEMVSIINSIAARTNLLALNATIEAARGGQHGKGFDIVALEIKKLSEGTRVQSKEIQAKVASLNENIVNTSKSLDDVAASYGMLENSINEAVSLIDGVGKSMEIVGRSFSEISANTQEQTAASQEMAADIMIINEKTAELKREANRTGQAFFDISLTLDTLRRKIYDAVDGVNNSVMIELCITDHMMWKWRVYNMLLGYTRDDIKKVANHRQCRLGMFVEHLSPVGENVREIIDHLEQPHAKLHDVTNKAMELYSKGKVAESEALLGEIEEASRDVVTVLGKLKPLLV